MTRIVLDIPNEPDLDALLPLLRRLRISVSTIDASPKTTPELEEALRIIRQGCDMSSFGDTLTWQKMARENRELPYRD